MRWMFLAVFVVCISSLFGCNSPAPKGKSGEGTKKTDEEVQQAFSSLQAAIKAKDGDKIWGLLAKDSQEDAERQAKAVKNAFAKLAESDKSAYEKKMGLSAKELADMTGKLYVKSNSFYTGETGEMPESKFDKVVVTGDSTATVHYIEDDGKGQRETRSAVREDGQWKLILPVSQAILK